MGMAMAMALGGDTLLGVYIWQLVRRSDDGRSRSPSVVVYRLPIPRPVPIIYQPITNTALPNRPLQQQAKSHPPFFHSPISILAGSPFLLAALRFPPYVLSSSLSITSPAPACSRLHQTPDTAPSAVSR